MTTQRARRVAVPSSAPIGDEMVDADYASAFELGTRGTRQTPERWARSVFEDAPAAMRVVLVLGWRLVLGLRMGPTATPDYVLGWHITEQGPNVVVLESNSPFLAAQNIVVTNDSTVSWSTLVRFDRWIARPIWAVVAPFHHRTIPYLLRRADREA
ncbi:DUF2867 domain-containing protein [Nocardia terpenica]|uniref:DUF2867 domain-containing protein n=1 Tax=Nocardia terpenica TaxID=455432 RepID=A0A164M026_9NOCA|nr:DUF2867 domain-containing protein [Nocardia terpenica]KZM72901.1 hypothetical protein AWN90_29565 [Nocardia terpenica]NQE92175.1 DUF2867 domain-containing protein [Nocardia terpenica]